MWQAISRLLGLKQGLDGGSGSTLRLLEAWRPVWLALLLAGIVAYYVWLYRRDAGRLSAGRRRLLTVLRVAVVAAVILMLLRPALSITSVERRAPVVGILVDESTSMSYPASRDNPFVDRGGDRNETSRLAAAREILTRLVGPDGVTQDHRAAVYRFSGTLEKIGEAAPLAEGPGPTTDLVQQLRDALTDPTGTHSHPSDALMEVVRQLRAKKVAGLVLISDGRSTSTPRSGSIPLEEAAAQLRQAGIPVHTIATGTPEPIRDLALRELIAPPEANLDDVVTMRVTVINHIAPGLQTELTLLEDGKPKVVRRVRLRSGRNDVALSTIAAGPKEGERKYTIKAPHFDDEWTYDNNHVSAHVNVVKRTLRCLLIAGTPTVEYHYLWPALVRDPIINVSCWLHDADVNYVQQGNLPIERLPATVEEWDRYDVVILYDIDPGKFTNEQETGLEQLVRKGGGLFVVAGRTHGLDTLLAVRTAKMAAMLPVEIDRNRHPDYDRVLDRPFRAVRTKAGRQHPIFTFEMSPTENDRVWSSFPEFYWAHPTMGAKPQAISLLEKEAVEKGVGSRLPVGPEGASHKRLPTPFSGSGRVLMALWRYGEGAVFYSGVHSIWRWRFPYENHDHDRFFSQITRYLGETRLLGAQKQVVLQTDRKLYTPGANVAITLSVLDPALLVQLRNERLLATVTDDRGAAFKVPLILDNARQGFVANYRPKRVGTYTVGSDHVLAETTSDLKKLFDETTHFDVHLQSLEEIDPTADLASLARLAQITGGRAYDHTNLSRLSELPGVIPADPQIISHRTQEEIWDSPLFWLIVVVLITTEWVLRKLWSLL